MNAFNLSTTIKRKDAHTLSSQVADEIVMLDTKTGDYIGLNPIGSSIWEKIARPVTVENLCNALLEEYEVTEQQCKDETLSFLNELNESGLLEVHA
jgi:Coenzyme PQQ synthesis protein D (PqqD)